MNRAKTNMALKNHDVKYLPYQMAQNYMHRLFQGNMVWIQVQFMALTSRKAFERTKRKVKKSTYQYPSAITDDIKFRKQLLWKYNPAGLSQKKKKKSKWRIFKQCTVLKAFFRLSGVIFETNNLQGAIEYKSRCHHKWGQESHLSCHIIIYNILRVKEDWEYSLQGTSFWYTLHSHWVQILWCDSIHLCIIVYFVRLSA